MSKETDNYFEIAVKFVKEAEGGLTDDKDDPGGLTNFGIDQRSHPNVDIRNLTWDAAKQIYYKEYWLASKADKVPFPACISFMDCVVNVGITQTNKFLQRIVGTKDDGYIGPLTLKAVESYADPKNLAEKLIDARQTFYNNLVLKREGLRKFLKGWTNRNNNLRAYITSL